MVTFYQNDGTSCSPFTLMVIIETNVLNLSINIEIFDPKQFLKETNNIYDENHVDHAWIITKEAGFLLLIILVMSTIIACE